MTDSLDSLKATEKVELPMDELRRFVDSLPHLPGVYRMLGEHEDVLYVGKAKDLYKRVRSYFLSGRQLGPRIQRMVSQIRRIEVTVARSEAEALLLESNLIKALNPRYNIIFRDDKSYAYLCLSNHSTPQLRFHRGALKAPHRYFGPYPSGLAVKHGIEVLQKVFRLRTCEDSVFANRSRPCMLYQIRRCSGPCVGAIDPNDYAQDVRDAERFLEGRTEEIMTSVQDRMEQASQRLEFEAAVLWRDRLKLLQSLRTQQYVHSHEARDQNQAIDVFGAVIHEGMLAINWVMMRGGRHCGDRTFFPQHAKGWEAETSQELVDDALLTFIMQHYQRHPLPDTVIVSVSVESLSLLQTALESLLQSGTHTQGLTNTVVVKRPTGARKVWLDMAQKNAQLAIAHRLQVDATQANRLAELQEAMGWDESVQRMECFDISHTQGEATVASCVVFDEGYMQPKQYRRFNVTPEQGGDDYAAMREVLTRRSQRILSGELPSPDVWLIDGGIGQLGVAKAVVEQYGLPVRLMAIAKGESRTAGLEQILRPGEPAPLKLPPHHAGLHLLQHIRDEAHRFAIEGHRARRAKARTQSVLDEMPGIGPKRKKALLTHFGGLRELEAASVDDLARVSGVSRSLAEGLYAWLHG